MRVIVIESTLEDMILITKHIFLRTKMKGEELKKQIAFIEKHNIKLFKKGFKI